MNPKRRKRVRKRWHGTPVKPREVDVLQAMIDGVNLIGSGYSPPNIEHEMLMRGVVQAYYHEQERRGKK